MNTEGILWEPTVIYNPHENGVAERVNRILKEMIRLILVDSDLPVEVWPELLNTAVYLRLRVSNKHLRGITPFKILYKRKPDLSHLRRIDCIY